jgi:hypothetical protein
MEQGSKLTLGLTKNAIMISLYQPFSFYQEEK